MTRERALGVLATFNPNAIQVPSTFVGWQSFFQMVHEVQQGYYVAEDRLVVELEDLAVLPFQAWIYPLLLALSGDN